MPALAHAQHATRAQNHLNVGVALHEAAENEWAAVAYFYAAYHAIKCALLKDPIWNDPAQLHAKHANLVPDDRFTTSHHGHKSSAHRVWGVNELVGLLYPAIAREYERLHQGSITVRYGIGLPEGALADLRVAVDTILGQADAGTLKAGN